MGQGRVLATLRTALVAAGCAALAGGGPAVLAQAPPAPIVPPATHQEWVQLTNADWGYYERMYGKPITMSVDTLLDEESVPQRQAIRTFGLFQVPVETLVGSNSTASFQICGETKGRRCLTFLTVSEIASSVRAEADHLRGERVMIVGAFDQAGFVVWSFEVMPESAKRAKDGKDSGLRALVAAAGQADKRPVRVRGQFRGRNLFGDLPGESRRNPSDWVIQDQGVAVWVTGKAPKGSGWSLDLDNRSDSIRWVEVEGEVVAGDGVLYLKAKSVSLVSGPVAAKAADP